MVDFIMMIGLPGSGKSVWARKEAGYGFHLISSDGYRKDLNGDESIQGDNQKLFQTIHKEIRDRLNNGESVIFDATNINYKHRIHLLDFLKNVTCRKTAVVMATPINECLERNYQRERVVPEYVIDRMWKSFTFPTVGEGWDDINIIYSEIDNDDFEEYYDIDAMLLDRMKGFAQDNPNHSKDLYGHTVAVCEHLNNQHDILRLAGALHDNGKIHTKTFIDAKGNQSNIAHFYNHENVGSYEAMFYLKSVDKNPLDVSRICGLIQNHMKLHTEVTEKTKLKLIRLLGEDGFSDLLKLAEADKKGK